MIFIIIKEEIRRNRAVVMEAARADSMVKQKYSPHKMNIQLLSESEVSFNCQLLILQNKIFISFGKL